MTITSVKISLVKSREKGFKIKAYAVIVFDDCFAVRGLRVVEKHAGGFFVAMPIQKFGPRRVDIAFPVNRETRAMIEEKVIAAYHEAIDKMHNSA